MRPVHCRLSSRTVSHQKSRLVSWRTVLHIYTRLVSCRTASHYHSRLASYRIAILSSNHPFVSSFFTLPVYLLISWILFTIFTFHPFNCIDLFFLNFHYGATWQRPMRIFSPDQYLQQQNYWKNSLTFVRIKYIPILQFKPFKPDVYFNAYLELNQKSVLKEIRKISQPVNKNE